MIIPTGRISVYVKPNSKHSEGVEVQESGEYIVYVKAPAIDGRANSAVVAVLAEHFGVAKSQVVLVKGVASRHKVFTIFI